MSLAFCVYYPDLKLGSYGSVHPVKPFSKRDTANRAEKGPGRTRFWVVLILTPES